MSELDRCWSPRFVSSQKSQSDYLVANGSIALGDGLLSWELGDIEELGGFGAERKGIVLSSIGSLGLPCGSFHLAGTRYKTDRMSS